MLLILMSGAIAPAKALKLVEQDLQAFLFCIDWAQEVGFTESSKLCQKFDECFNVKMAF